MAARRLNMPLSLLLALAVAFGLGGAGALAEGGPEGRGVVAHGQDIDAAPRSPRIVPPAAPAVPACQPRQHCAAGR